MPELVDPRAIEYQDTLYKYIVPLVFRLPGWGEARSTCGEPVYLGHLLDRDLHYVKHKRSCHRFECPTCWQSWKKRAVLDIVDRLQEYIKLTHRKMVHYVVSPPQSIEYDTIETYRKLRKEAYRVAKQRGIKGGVMIFHERAARYSDPKTYEKSHCSRGAHFHIVGDGWLSNVREFFLEDGWIVKNLRLRNLGGVYRTLNYVLDHAVRGYPAISHPTLDNVVRLETITWFGTMSYNQLKIQKFSGSDSIFCPICKEEIPKNDWYVLGWTYLKDPPPDVGNTVLDPDNGFHIVKPISAYYVP
jgi:hypothetical protein